MITVISAKGHLTEHYTGIILYQIQVREYSCTFPYISMLASTRTHRRARDACTNQLLQSQVTDLYSNLISSLLSEDIV